MAKSPHNPEYRAKVSQEYLDRLGSYVYLSTKYNIGSKTLKQWVAKYRFYGIVDDIVVKHNISSREVLRQ